MARQSASARAAAATTNNTITKSVAIESIADVTATKMEVIADYLRAHDRSTERIKAGLSLLKAIPGLIPSVDEYLMMSRLLVETRVSRARPAFSPDTLRRRRVQLKDSTLNQMRAAYQAARDRFLVILIDGNSKSSDSAHPSSPPALASAAKFNSSEPQQSAQKAVKITSTTKPTLAQPLAASALKIETPKLKTRKAEPLLKQTTLAVLTSDSTPLKTQVTSINTAVVEAPKVALPVVESPSPATKILAPDSAKFKIRRSRNKKAKVPASPSLMGKTKVQAVATPQSPSSDFDFRASPTKQALVRVDATVPAHASTHVRSISDSSSTSSFIFAGRSRGASSSSLDEDKPSTGKTTPHRLSEASEFDKPLDLFTEFAPEHFVEVDLTFLNEVSSVTDETTTTSVTEVVTVDTPIDEEVDSLSVEEALLAAVANDTSSAFLKRTTGRSSSKNYEDLIPTPLSTFGKTTVMVKQMMDNSNVDYHGEKVEAHNIELMNSLDLYHHSALPKMTLSTDQVQEQAAFDLAMSKHHDELLRHAAQEDAPNVPRTKADAQMSALFSIGLQSVEKNGTIFFNPHPTLSKPAKEEISDIEQDPAIVSMIAPLPSGTGLFATLTQLGPNRPLASWYKSMTPTMKSHAPIEIPDIEQDPAIISMIASFPSGTGLSATLTQLGPNHPLASWHKSITPTKKSSTPTKSLEAAISRMRARALAKSATPNKGLSATLTKLGPNSPLVSWHPSMPTNNLNLAISRMRAREVAKSAVANLSVPFPFASSVQTVSSSMKFHQ
ncbi:hypothetical protein E6O75_ATG05680 [Venturia nashicola]|uniref:Uncharacterized protein n=1 Tax=Venturia nashicola TaxID=86259 RepID=A0A4Z1P041_9PEZI|nr:hypothetical protein E6O75_ATG05680 [Venturia nashicola]